MQLNKQKDLEQRKKDTQWDIELFLKVHERLPNKKCDRVTKKTAKQYLDMCLDGRRKPDTMLMKFAFHVYASSNLAYEKE